PNAVGAVAEVMSEVHAVLALAGIPLPRDEARDIVAALLDVPRFWPTLHGDKPSPAGLPDDALAAARKRASGAPFAYAVGRAAFRHLTLAVDERVLIPRQETELLVDLVLRSGLTAGGTAIDIGTGSGAIALALATEGAFERVIASDVSDDALAVAARNVERCRPMLRAPVQLVKGSFLAPFVHDRARVIVSNPPYIAFSEIGELPPNVRDWEPALALLTPSDGMAATRS